MNWSEPQSRHVPSPRPLRGEGAGRLRDVWVYRRPSPRPSPRKGGERGKKAHAANSKPQKGGGSGGVPRLGYRAEAPLAPEARRRLPQMRPLRMAAAGMAPGIGCEAPPPSSPRQENKRPVGSLPRASAITETSIRSISRACGPSRRCSWRRASRVRKALSSVHRQQRTGAGRTRPGGEVPREPNRRGQWRVRRRRRPRH